MIDLNKYFNLWKRTLQKPQQTFKSEMRRASLNEFAMHMVVAGLISGLITGILAAVGIGTTSLGAYSGITAFVGSLVITPILFLVGTLIGSAILYVIALLLGGKGNFTQQSYLLALFNAPLSILMNVLIFIPILGFVAIIVLGIYSLYLLTLSLKEVHRFSTGRAIMVWLIPIFIALLLAAILAAAIASFLMSMYGPGLTV